MAAPAGLSAVAAAAALRVACRWVPMHDGEPCGDAAGHFVWPDPCSAPGAPDSAAGRDAPRAACAVPQHLLAIIDGLGHGPEAAIAAQAAMDLLAAHAALPLAELFVRLDARLVSTRGAAIGLVQVHGQRLRHAGVGNTRALHRRGEAVARLPSQNGIVGGGVPARLVVNELDLAPGDWLLLYTDGIQEAVHLPVELPEWRRDPATLCQHVLTHWHSGRDDAGVLALWVEGG